MLRHGNALTQMLNLMRIIASSLDHRSLSRNPTFWKAQVNGELLFTLPLLCRIRPSFDLKARTSFVLHVRVTILLKLAPWAILLRTHWMRENLELTSVATYCYNGLE
jgi:hypothetical protein